MSITLAIVLHLISINIWFGGTFYAVVILPPVFRHLGAQQRQQSILALLQRFFLFLWGSLVVLLASGGWMIYQLFGSPLTAPLYVVLMAGFGLTMVLVFIMTFFGPYQRLRRAVTANDTALAERQLTIIQRLGVLNLVLGFCVVLVVGGGPHLLV